MVSYKALNTKLKTLGKGSNRTFMELKFKKRIYTTLGVISSNRTFMELKCLS